MLSFDPARAVPTIAMPFLVGFGVSCAGLVVFGIPLTLWLYRKRKENQAVYTIAGTLAGAMLALIVVLAFGIVSGSAAAILIAFCALTAGVTGNCWWRFGRRAVVANDPAYVGKVFE